MIFVAAILADPIDLKRMPGSEIVILESDFLLEAAYFLGEKLNRVAALRANHVVMAAAVVLMLVARDAVVERDFAGQSAFSQQL